jgi:hypothetical protein
MGETTMATEKQKTAWPEDVLKGLVEGSSIPKPFKQHLIQLWKSIEQRL